MGDNLHNTKKKAKDLSNPYEEDDLADKFDECLKINKSLDTPNKSKNIYIVSDDPRLNYTITNHTDDPSELSIIPREKFDYGVVVKKGEEETEDNVGTLDETLPISYTTIKDPVVGEKWYRNKYPNLPEDFYGVIARYTWGQPQTKKSVRNEKKKYEKKKDKNKQAPQGLSILQGKFLVGFD